MATKSGDKTVLKYSRIFFISCIVAVFICSCSRSNVNQESTDYGFVEDETEQKINAPVETQAVPVAAPIAEPAPKITAIRPDTPESYLVKRGDTLWDIASLFLRDPWLWPEIWYFNPQIDNPHLIYPGDIITLVYVDGQPRLQLSRDGSNTTITKITEPSAPAGLGTYKLSPKVREEGLDTAIPTIAINTIEPFLAKPRVITKEQLDEAPYIVSSLDDHLVSGVGHSIYARQLPQGDDVRYDIFRPGRVFKNPGSGEILGYETILVSEAKLQKHGDPATLVITRSKRETLNGDRILPAEKGTVNHNFIPRAPEVDLEGTIIAFVDAISHTAQNQMVIVNLGQRDGLEIGNVLSVHQAGTKVRDNYAPGGQEIIKMPDVESGIIMIFRTFDRVSYGLIMKSTRAIHLNDKVTNPSSAANLSQ